MSKKLTKEEFIERVFDKFPENKEHYCYDDVLYNGNKIKVKIFCRVCNKYFNITPLSHLNGSGCKQCGIERSSKKQRKTKEQFEEQAREVHGNDYEYPDDYINTITEMRIWCKKCQKYFELSPSKHLQGQGCPDCAIIKRKNNNTKTKEQFVLDAREVHGDDYEYPDDYISAKTIMRIWCNKCQDFFEKAPHHHLSGSGCTECAKIEGTKKRTKTKEQFVLDAREVHGDDYEYPDDYIGSKIKMRIWCNKCQDYFNQRPNDHLQGDGCFRCKNSKGEKRIRNILKDQNIDYKSQKKFKECKNILQLPFDFYIPELNLCIEYQGEQHYKIVDFSWGKLTKKELQEKFEKVQKHDNIKRKFCKENNINLLEIPYTEFKNIKEIIKREVINKL